MFNMYNQLQQGQQQAMEPSLSQYIKKPVTSVEESEEQTKAKTLAQILRGVGGAMQGMGGNPTQQMMTSPQSSQTSVIPVGSIFNGLDGQQLGTDIGKMIKKW